MTRRANRRWSWGLIAALGLAALPVWTAAQDGPKIDDAALKRTRKQVRMLDDIYKTAVVLITDKYVHKEDDFAAGSAAVALFKAIKEKGWHEARLVDATGKPYNDENVPQDAFEKNAIKALKAGKTDFEQIVAEDGQHYLRAATPVPVVLKKCAICHPHYSDVKEGQPIGAIVYKLKIE